MQEFKVEKLAAGARVDVFVAEKYPQFTRSALRGLFGQQKVHINQKQAKPSYKLRYGDNVSVNSDSLTAQPEKIDLPVIYEDPDVVVINKPAGVLTHSKGALNLEPTVASWLRNHVLKNTPKDALGSGLWTLDSRQSRAGIVHRLDRATSGLIIGAKKAKSLAFLQKQFSSRKVKKTYLAVVEGRPDPGRAIIDVPIARNPKKPQTFRVSGGGKIARTEYKVRHSSDKYSLLELVPETGRTHQLRVHMAYIGHPIVGDSVYGHGGGDMLLHAYKLELTLPSGKRRLFSAPPPGKFKNFGKL